MPVGFSPAFRPCHLSSACTTLQRRRAASVALSRLRRKILLVLSFQAVHLRSLRQRIPLDGDIRPLRGEICVKLQPHIQTRLGIRLDRPSGTFRLAYAAVDAFIRMDDEEVLPLIKTIHRADFDAVRVLTANAVIGHDIRHEVLQPMLTFDGRRQSTVTLDRPRMLGMSGAHSCRSSPECHPPHGFVNRERSRGETTHRFNLLHLPSPRKNGPGAAALLVT
ncbi:hypothetical protein EMEDMD4_380056 [Sinorhizobium medicae]|uniref:Uncharacterized protein n=1 Tax=Sinorhizobium medicae TaxID=110321 RepID=A0A508WYG1_9HYPH|nr:hypothetical protein EMEDMD4_380056 [Sinorhizobium medicae]